MMTSSAKGSIFRFTAATCYVLLCCCGSTASPGFQRTLHSSVGNSLGFINSLAVLQLRNSNAHLVREVDGSRRLPGPISQVQCGVLPEFRTSFAISSSPVFCPKLKRTSVSISMAPGPSDGDSDFCSEQASHNATGGPVSVHTLRDPLPEVPKFPKRLTATLAEDGKEERRIVQEDQQEACRGKEAPAARKLGKQERKTGDALSRGGRVQGEPVKQPCGLSVKERVDTLVIGKVIIDEFVLRRQPEARIVRTGLGGGSPQAAVGARLWGRNVGLVAPVGQSFADEMLCGLEMSGVDTRGVARLAGYVTPRNQIRYQAERMIWTPAEGWDKWEQLNAELLPLPDQYRNASLLHVITEGGGGAEATMVAKYRAEKGEDQLLVSIEPVIHQVSEGLVEALRPQTSRADLVSPDWDAALAISRLPPALPLTLAGSAVHPELMGRYELLPEQQGGRPAYKLADGNAFLYFSPGAARWYVGPVLGSSVACLFIESETATPDLSDGTWQEYDEAAKVWGPADAVAVTRSQRGVSFTDSLGTRRKFTVKQGWLAMTVDDGSDQEVTQMVYNSVHGQVAVDGEVSFLLQSQQKNRVARRLRALCAAAGVEWDEDGSLKKEWEDVDTSLVVTGKRQGVWQGLVDAETGGVYYWNTITDQTTWTRPPELMRVSKAQETKRFQVRNIKGDVTKLPTNGSGTLYLNASSDQPPEPPLAGSPEDAPARVLVRCAQQLGMTKGILAVRRGSRGSYVLDCAEPSRVWEVPALSISVVDPTGAGNAYSSAFAANLAVELGRDSRMEAILASACRATATGAAFVACEGLPLPSDTIKEWLQEQSKSLRARVMATPLLDKDIKQFGRPEGVSKPDPDANAKQF